MKCLQICVVFIGVALSIICVSSRNIEPVTVNCENEAWELFHQIDSCGPGSFDGLSVVSILQKFSNHTINSSEFAQAITEYCATLNSATTCSLGKIPNNQPACRHYPLTERFVNLLRIVVQLEEEFCSEQILYNIAKDSGFICLAELSTGDCRHEAPVLQQFTYRLDDNHICANIKRSETCATDFFEECQNDGQIKKYVGAAFNSLNDLFSCNI